MQDTVTDTWARDSRLSTGHPVLLRLLGVVVERSPELHKVGVVGLSPRVGPHVPLFPGLQLCHRPTWLTLALVDP